MPKVTEMFAFVIADKDKDDEGVVGIPTGGGGTMPLVGADLKRVESLKPLAKRIAKEMGKPIRILRFSHMEEIERISPI